MAIDPNSVLILFFTMLCSVSQTFSKAKKRVGDQLNKIGFKKGKKKNKSLEETQGSCKY